MISKRKLIGNELLREIIRIRIDGLGRMVELARRGRLPKKLDEGATGEFDNKGALFVPGGMVFEDSDRQPVRKQRVAHATTAGFRELVRNCMQNDNASLLFPDGYLSAVNLDNGFFAEASSQILATKLAAGRRPRSLESRPPRRIRSDHICKSFCPESMPSPYGSRTKISSCLAVCLSQPRLYFLYCRNEFGLRGAAERRAWERIRSAREAILSEKRKVLAPPFIVVCHQTRYKEQTLGGITRILGIGGFGEFATVTFEFGTAELLDELKEKNIPWGDPETLGVLNDRPVLGVIRVFPGTRPGARSRGTQLALISPLRDLGFSAERLLNAARKKYQMD